jgi:tRNA U34 5-methylaminomethyl-2-thiouridine-forming methyltransferase MnmC
VQSKAGYEIVQLANGTRSVRSLAHAETFHPVIGPAAEAEALYVRQLKLPERLRNGEGEFVIWDVGLGAAANVMTVLRATRGCRRPLRIVSFDDTIEPLRFALEHQDALGYFSGYAEEARRLAEAVSTASGLSRIQFEDGARTVSWEVHLADFPSLLIRATQAADTEPALPSPHGIFFDAFSPAKNPAMWTQPLFAKIFSLLDPRRPCALATYSRSTLLRVSLLLAGFYAGSGHATGEKEETTIAANRIELLDAPLDRNWLKRARNSTSAEPLWEPVYRQAPLSEASWERLCNHPQFAPAREDQN